jgi:transposase
MHFRSKKKESAWTVEFDSDLVSFVDGKLSILPKSLCHTSMPDGMHETTNHKCLPYRGSWKRRRGSRARRKVYKMTPPPDETRMRVFEKPPFAGHPDHFCKIHYDGCGRYFLLVPVAATTDVPADKMRRPAVGVDPGVRKMMTTYDTNGVAAFLGVSRTDRLVGLWRRMEKLRAGRKTMDALGVHRSRKKIKKAKALYSDIKNDMHWQLAAYLSTRHSAVFFQKPDLREWTKTQRANGSVRLAASGMGLFLERLKEACAKRGTWLPDVDENYTTKTCSACGAVKWDVGSAEVFECDYCHAKMDRDVNGAKNMLLKHIDHRQIRPDERRKPLRTLAPRGGGTEGSVDRGGRSMSGATPGGDA